MTLFLFIWLCYIRESVFFTVFLRGHAHYVLEGVGELASVIVADGACNFENSSVTFAELLCSMLHAFAAGVGEYGESEYILEAKLHCGRRHVEFFGEFFDCVMRNVQ